MNYSDYVDQYNLGDHAALVRRFYTDDVVFESGALKRVCRGKDKVIEFLVGMQGGVKGEHLTVKVFIAYYLREEKVCRVKTALWPANFCVSDPPSRQL
jgi:hypothetical protein